MIGTTRLPFHQYDSHTRNQIGRHSGSFAADRVATGTARAPGPLRGVAAQTVPHLPRYETAKRRVWILVRSRFVASNSLL